MSRIDEAFDTQYEYNYFINLALKENDISNITYEQLQERVDNLNYYKTLSNMTPYYIYYDTNNGSIHLMTTMICFVVVILYIISKITIKI